MRGISGVADDLLTSQEGLCSKELVSRRSLMMPVRHEPRVNSAKRRPVYITACPISCKKMQEESVAIRFSMGLRAVRLQER
jgi:hypothetical protein